MTPDPDPLLGVSVTIGHRTMRRTEAVREVERRIVSMRRQRRQGVGLEAAIGAFLAGMVGVSFRMAFVTPDPGLWLWVAGCALNAWALATLIVNAVTRWAVMTQLIKGQYGLLDTIATHQTDES